MKKLLIILLFIPIVSFAQHECQGGHNCNKDGTPIDINNALTGGSIAGDRSYAVGLSHSLGDVDIAQCIASTQWGTIIVSKQGVILNLWCVAEVYDRKGMFDNAAKARCDIGEIARWYSDNKECLKAETWTPPPPEEPDEPETTGVPISGLSEQFSPEKFDDYEERLSAIEKRQQAAARAAAKRLQVAQKTLEALENDPES